MSNFTEILWGKTDDKTELELQKSSLKDHVGVCVSTSTSLSLECDAAAAVWGLGSGIDTEEGRKVKVARRRGTPERLLRIRTETTKVDACDVVSTESEMGAK